MAYLKKNSHLPGPRGNLELLYDFALTADVATVEKCLDCIKPDTANSPQEFAGMCGILGHAVLNKADVKGVLDFLRPFASHSSWRIREAVAMAIQEISVGRLDETLSHLESWIAGTPFEQRAVVAGLCEPKLLGNKTTNTKILRVLGAITANMDHSKKLLDSERSLRKALGYGWSVVIAAAPKEGKKAFARLFVLRGRHIVWIVKENLKKNRLYKMDPNWVKNCTNGLLTK
jgi:hypothetical protein